MTDGQSLLAILILLYLSDCLWWLPRHAVLLTGARPRRWQFRFCSGMLARDSGGPAPLPLLPWPRLCMLQTQPWHFSFSAHAITANHSLSWNKDGRRPQTGATLRYEDITRVEAKGDQVWINDVPWLTCISRAQALDVVRMVLQLQASTPEARIAALDALWQSHLDVAAVTERLGAIRKATLFPQITGLLQCITMFIIAPVISTQFGLAFTIIPLGLLLLATVVLNAIAYNRAHRRLHPENTRGRRGHTLMLLISWPMAARAADIAMRHSVHASHPLAVLAATASSASAQALADRLLRDLHHPVSINEIPDHARDVLFAHNALHAKNILQFMRHNGLNDQQWNAPPSLSEKETSYCPRCLSTYMRGDGDCSDCAGVNLLTPETVSE